MRCDLGLGWILSRFWLDRFFNIFCKEEIACHYCILLNPHLLSISHCLFTLARALTLAKVKVSVSWFVSMGSAN